MTNLEGEAIGINVAQNEAARPEGGEAVHVALAIPADVVQLVVRTLIANGRVTRSTIGVLVEPRSSGELQLLQVFPDGPAERAGLRVDDILISVDGIPFHGDRPNSYWEFLPPGTLVEIEVLRRGQEKPLTFTVELGELREAG